MIGLPGIGVCAHRSKRSIQTLLILAIGFGERFTSISS
jgi:hypothetical protein